MENHCLVQVGASGLAQPRLYLPAGVRNLNDSGECLSESKPLRLLSCGSRPFPRSSWWVVPLGHISCSQNLKSASSPSSQLFALTSRLPLPPHSCPRNPGTSKTFAVPLSFDHPHITQPCSILVESSCNMSARFSSSLSALLILPHAARGLVGAFSSSVCPVSSVLSLSCTHSSLSPFHLTVPGYVLCTRHCTRSWRSCRMEIQCFHPRVHSGRCFS